MASSLPVTVVAGPADAGAVEASLRDLDAATLANQAAYLDRTRAIEEAILSVLVARKPASVPPSPAPSRPEFQYLEPVDKLQVARLDSSYKLERLVGNTRVTGELMKAQREEFVAKVKALSEDLARDTLKKQVDKVASEIAATRAYVATVGAQATSIRTGIAEQLDRFLLAVKDSLNGILGADRNPLRAYTGLNAANPSTPEALLQFFTTVLDELRTSFASAGLSIDQLRGELQASQQARAALAGQIAAATAERDAAQAAARTASSALRECQESGSVANTRIKELEASLGVATAERNEAIELRRVAGDDTRKAESEASRSLGRAREAEKRAEAAENQLRELRSAGAAEEAKLREVEEQARQAAAQLVAQQARVRDLETQYADLNARSQQALTSMGQQIEKARQDAFSAAREESAKNQEEFRARVDELQRKKEAEWDARCREAVEGVDARRRDAEAKLAEAASSVLTLEEGIKAEKELTRRAVERAERAEATATMLENSIRETTERLRKEGNEPPAASDEARRKRGRVPNVPGTPGATVPDTPGATQEIGPTLLGEPNDEPSVSGSDEEEPTKP